MEAVLGRLDAKKDEWAQLGMLERAELLRKTLKCVIQVGANALHLTLMRSLAAASCK